jgi:hypothetical protein
LIRRKVATAEAHNRFDDQRLNSRNVGVPPSMELDSETKSGHGQQLESVLVSQQFHGIRGCADPVHIVQGNIYQISRQIEVVRDLHEIASCNGTTSSGVTKQQHNFGLQCGIG